MPHPPYLRFLIDRFWARHIATFGLESVSGAAALVAIEACLREDGYDAAAADRP